MSNDVERRARSPSNGQGRKHAQLLGLEEFPSRSSAHDPSPPRRIGYALDHSLTNLRLFVQVKDRYGPPLGKMEQYLDKSASPRPHVCVFVFCCRSSRYSCANSTKLHTTMATRTKMVPKRQTKGTVCLLSYLAPITGGGEGGAAVA